jgi:DNA-binding transcriptional ArsR family regulator
VAAKGKTTKKKPQGRGKQKPAGVNLQLVKALAHELRVEILTILNERMASPNELSKELDEGLSQVSYHVKVLKDYDCITQVKTVPRRGAVEHYYRATSRPYISDRDWQKLPDSVREGMSADLMQMILDDVSAGLDAGTVDARKDRHMSRTPLLLDETGWKDVGAILNDALGQIMRVQSESTDRLAKSGEEGVDAMVAMMGVEVPGVRPKSPKLRKGKAKVPRGKAKARASARK